MRKLKRRICIMSAVAALTAVGGACMASNAVSPNNAGVGYGSVTAGTLPNGTVTSVTTPAFEAP